uniref:C-type lectin domain-containing protein n=1 Tax=Acrobeloides nanus TaxID=290746 RepID=A0A914CW43_9BILA
MSRFLFYIFVVYLKLVYAKSGFLDNAATANADFTPCSQNTSTATLRIVLVIDTSTNMGSTNLRQIGLSLSSELSEYTISNKTLDTVCADTYCWNASNSVSYNSNVAIVTYSDTYTLVGDFSDFASNADVNSALLSLKPSSSNSVNGLIGALKLAYNLSDVSDPVPFKKSLAVLWFPASVKNLTLFEVAIGGRTAMYREELVAVNYNPNDRNLTNMLNQLEIPYIFNKTQPNIYDNIHWALLQLNCHCGFNVEFQPKVYNKKINQWEKTADCFIFKVTKEDTKFCQNHPEIAIDSDVKFSAMQEAGHGKGCTKGL